MGLDKKEQENIRKSVKTFYKFLRNNNCEYLASNKDGLSILSHSLELWGKARYETGSPKENPMKTHKTNTQKEIKTLKNINPEKLQKINTYRF